MGPKARKHNKPDHRKGLQKTWQPSDSDFDDWTNPPNRSSNAAAKSTDQLKDQSDGAHALPVADSTLSCLESDLSLSGSASKTNTDGAGATSCQSLELGVKVRRTKEDEQCSDAPVEAAALSGGHSASERLMQQIDSLLRDSEFIAPHKPKLAFEEFELKHTDDYVPEPNFMLETGPDSPEMSTADAGNVTRSNNLTEPYSGASHKVWQSQDAEKLYEVESLSNLARADFFLADDENLGDFLNLLQHLNGE